MTIIGKFLGDQHQEFTNAETFVIGVVKMKYRHEGFFANIEKTDSNETTLIANGDHMGVKSIGFIIEFRNTGFAARVTIKIDTIEVNTIERFYFLRYFSQFYAEGKARTFFPNLFGASGLFHFLNIQPEPKHRIIHGAITIVTYKYFLCSK